VVYIGDRPAQVSTDGSGIASAFYNLGYLLISDGEDSSLAYLSFAQDESSGTATISVPLAYYSPSGDGVDALLELGLDPATGSIISETYYTFNQDAGTYGELSVEPAGLIVPLVQVLQPGATQYEWIETTGTGLSAELASLQYGVEPIPSGTRMVVELWVYDYGGNADYVSAVITVP